MISLLFERTFELEPTESLHQKYVERQREKRRNRFSSNALFMKTSLDFPAATLQYVEGKKSLIITLGKNSKPSDLLMKSVDESFRKKPTETNSNLFSDKKFGNRRISCNLMGYYSPTLESPFIILIAEVAFRIDPNN
ncbi:hypothetical protein CDAR_275991 [Caerostris darwini]|uniref:Uncharacterized protein n=1 Tax=Caerostris darwini TaxID=1538125 RepID=A0AAV4QJ18_9ARAC|nr:hypothetical protein CDAR_275991 [Caerostris darwini]